MPQRPELPGDSSPQRSSVATIVVMASLGLFVLVVLVVLTIVFSGGIFVLVGIFLFAAFHYFVWGWWLSKLIRQEDETDSTGPPPDGPVRGN